MRRFLRYLKAAWLYSRFFPYIEEAEEPGFWDKGDALKLHQFIESHTGRKFGHMLRNYAIKAACAAVKNPTNSPYNNGVAAGIPMLITAIENLSAGVPTDTESESNEAEAGLDRLETTA
jgi:hypothetical protein